MHLKKRLKFHGVDYIVVPLELWQEALSWAYDAADQGWDSAMELCDRISQYDENSELTDE